MSMVAPNLETSASAAAPVGHIRLLGNHPCLDFVNTVDDRVHGARDSLVDYESLATWAVRVGVIDGGEAAALRRLAEADPERAARAFDRAVELRERLYRIFAAVAGGAAPPPGDLDALQATFGEGMTHARVVERRGGFAWSWRGAAPDRIGWGVARSALDLLFSDRLGRLKICPGHDCGWLFLDLSRNRSRRWCSMDGCGSRAKMRTLYRRRRAAGRARLG